MKQPNYFLPSVFLLNRASDFQSDGCRFNLCNACQHLWHMEATVQVCNKQLTLCARRGRSAEATSTSACAAAAFGVMDRRQWEALRFTCLAGSRHQFCKPGVHFYNNAQDIHVTHYNGHKQKCVTTKHVIPSLSCVLTVRWYWFTPQKLPHSRGRQHKPGPG